MGELKRLAAEYRAAKKALATAQAACESKLLEMFPRGTKIAHTDFRDRRSADVLECYNLSGYDEESGSAEAGCVIEARGTNVYFRRIVSPVKLVAALELFQ